MAEAAGQQGAGRAAASRPPTSTSSSSRRARCPSRSPPPRRSCPPGSASTRPAPTTSAPAAPGFVYASARPSAADPRRPGAQRARRRLRAVLRLARHDRPLDVHHPRPTAPARPSSARPTSRASARSCGAATASSSTRSPSTSEIALLPPGGPGRLPLGHLADGAGRARGLPPRRRRPVRARRVRPAPGEPAHHRRASHDASAPPTPSIARDIVTSGNTSAASIPLALSRMVERGEIPSGAPGAAARVRLRARLRRTGRSRP